MYGSVKKIKIWPNFALKGQGLWHCKSCSLFHRLLIVCSFVGQFANPSQSHDQIIRLILSIVSSCQPNILQCNIGWFVFFHSQCIPMDVSSYMPTSSLYILSALHNITHYFIFSSHNEIYAKVIFVDIDWWVHLFCFWDVKLGLIFYYPRAQSTSCFHPYLPCWIPRWWLETKPKAVWITSDGFYSFFTPPPGSNLEQGKGRNEAAGRREGGKVKATWHSVLSTPSLNTYLGYLWGITIGTHVCPNQNISHSLLTHMHTHIIFFFLFFFHFIIFPKPDTRTEHRLEHN